jgi:hypothetical protein
MMQEVTHAAARVGRALCHCSWLIHDVPSMQVPWCRICQLLLTFGVTAELPHATHNTTGEAVEFALVLLAYLHLLLLLPCLVAILWKELSNMSRSGSL